MLLHSLLVYVSTFLTFLSTAHGFPRRRAVLVSGAKCPSAWKTIAADLAKSFLVDGQCTDMARGAIRYAFHDACAFSTKLPFYPPAAGGADGSLLLSPDEIKRSENAGLEAYHDFLVNKFNVDYANLSISAADLIQFAGAIGVTSCPGGEVTGVVVGRADTSASPPQGLLPAGFGPGSDHDTLLQLFRDKGFDARELAALLGAHTVARMFNQTQYGVRSGMPTDSTPGLWDIDFYAQTYKPVPGMARLESDINLSRKNTTVGLQFSKFVNNQFAWTNAFQDAFHRMSLLGIPDSDMTNFSDCTNVALGAFST